MFNSRPVAPHFPFKLPAAALASITHRVSGVSLFGLVALGLGWLALAMSSPEGFETAVGIAGSWWGSLLILLGGMALSYHLISAMRHSLQDMGHFHELESGRNSAIAVFVLAFLATIALALVLWL